MRRKALWVLGWTVEIIAAPAMLGTYLVFGIVLGATAATFAFLEDFGFIARNMSRDR